MLSVQRKSKISASRKLMLKVREIMNQMCLANYNVIHAFDHMRAAEVTFSNAVLYFIF